MPVTSKHDFFGSSVVEAIYCGAFPILPRRLAYPEHIPASMHEKFFYNDFKDLVARSIRAITEIEETRDTAASQRELLKRYDWSELAKVYDEAMSAVVEKRR